MLRLNVLDSAVNGYKLVWANRQYLLKLALVPIALKYLCYVIIIAYDLQQDFIKQSIILLPAYMAEGWMLSHLVRLIYFGQTWPYRPQGDARQDLIILQDKARGIMAGILAYTIFKYLTGAYLAVAYQLISITEGVEADAVPTSIMIAMLVLPVFAFWAFRFLWLHIAAAANYDLKRFVLKIRGFWSSLPILSIWFLCFFPMFFLLMTITSAIFAPEDILGNKGIAMTFHIFKVFADAVIALTSTAAMSLAFLTILKNDKDKS